MRSLPIKQKAGKMFIERYLKFDKNNKTALFVIYKK